ncbi:Pentatricopeptide repeat [Quillaja saponaria]|uniref:Pentatricopeptide repeat n=1 Tax=Quillaja saponaria TaxID=32244 RepID=A0AAD7LQ71_QUISA|nr:Pentatricopeptide repeat [Quillaja saponaria]
MVLCVNSRQPWNSTHPTLFHIQKCKTINDVNQLHARMLTTGFIRNTLVTTKIILSFISSPHAPLVEFARYLFFTHNAFQTRPENEDPFLWNAIVKSYSHGCDPRGSLMVLCLMLENGVGVDKFSLSLVLKACSRLGLVKEGMQIHGLLRKMGIGSDLFLQNCLIGLFLRCGCIQFARQVFDRMPNRDSVSYNSMIDGYVKHGILELARELFDYMPPEERNLISWNSMIGGYVQSKNGMKVAWNLFQKMPQRDLISWNTLIGGCINHGKMEDARALFSKMPRRDLISWATMIDGYAKLGSISVARALFDTMPERDVVACNTMMAGYVHHAIAQLGHIEIGVMIHHYLEDNGYPLDGKLGVALIDMYSKCGSIEDAISIFENIEEKRVDHWNAMIGGLAIHGWGDVAFDFLMEMERLSTTPDDITFIGVLNACGHAGLVKEGLICFELMRRVHKVDPKVQHYGCMVDILGRAGHIEAARKFVEEMPIEPNDVIWRTLLGACKLYEKFNIGETVGKQLIRMDSCSPSSYVLLSNIYAGMGMWNDVKSVRTMMEERNLKKIPGCSWIELGGIVHEFSVQDKSHPQVAGNLFFVK